MLSLFRRLMMNTQGAVVIEYTLIVSLIAVAAICLDALGRRQSLQRARDMSNAINESHR